MWTSGFRLCLLLAGILLLHGVTSQQDPCQDAPAQKTVYHCLDEDDLTVTCPQGHAIRVILAFLWQNSSCTRLSTEDSCWQASYSEEFIQRCSGRRQCVLPMAGYRQQAQNIRSCNSKAGPRNHFFEVVYMCVDVRKAMSLCGRETRTASSVEVVSHPDGLGIEATDCACVIRNAPHDAYLAAVTLKKATSAVDSRICQQLVNIYTPGRNIELCEMTDDADRQCNPRPDAVNITLKNFDAQDQVSMFFSFAVVVPEQRQFTIECGLGGSGYRGVSGKLVDINPKTGSAFGIDTLTTTTSTTASTATTTTTTTRPTTTTTTTTPTTTTTTTPTTTTTTTTRPTTTTTTTTPTTTTTTAPTTTTTTTTPTTTTKSTTTTRRPTTTIKSTTTTTPTTTTKSTTTTPPTTTTKSMTTTTPTTTTKSTTTSKGDEDPFNSIPNDAIVYYEQDDTPFPKNAVIATGAVAGIVLMISLVTGTILYAKYREKKKSGSVSGENIYDEMEEVPYNDRTVAMPANDDVATNPVYGKSQDIFAY